MRSIRAKITTLTLGAILTSIVALGLIGLYFVILESNHMSSQVLSLTCENRKDALNDYLNSIEQSVNMISRYADDSLDSVALTEGGVLGASGEGVEEIPGRSSAQRKEMDQYFDEHLAFIEKAFQSIANHTNGIASCYYRLNPEITTTKKGFFFAKEGVSDFSKIELTDIERYDPNDMNNVGWYYIPLKQGRPSWLDPYYNAAQETWVISYAVPLFKAGTFIGIVGMDIQFDTLRTQIQQFTNFDTGYFALTNDQGRLFYHPEYEMGTEVGDVLPQLDTFVESMRQSPSSQQLGYYEKDGASWLVYFTTLVSGMKLVAAVQESEVYAVSNSLTAVFVIAGTIILLAFALLTALTVRRLTDPLERLTTAARRLAASDYDVELSYEGNDEVGVLTSAFGTMRDQLKAHINELSAKAFKDDLTGVKSKHAYVEDEELLDERIARGDVTEFAVVMFDLNDLKTVNDTYGHEVGDQYLKRTAQLICDTFAHSSIYRTGGDEFVALLEGADYDNRDELLATFDRQMDANIAQRKPSVASGCAIFDPTVDAGTHSVLERADERMYARKKHMKEHEPDGPRTIVWE